MPDHIVVCALYKFTRLANYRSLQAPLHHLMQQLQVRGTLLLAIEGINGTIAGSSSSIEQLLEFVRQQPGLEQIDIKQSSSNRQPFRRAKVKLKKEIVTMGVAGIDPRHVVGAYVEPQHWNALIDDPQVLVVDTRNSYEIAVGTFENAINPQTESFRDFPAFARDHLDRKQHPKIAMFCTGGIRCEKSTALLKQMGFENVYHLKGGILRYLEQVPESQSKWRGECFVFDDRVTLDRQLHPGSFAQCHACRLPLSVQAMQSQHYVEGVSCSRCYDKVSPQDKARFAERQRQVTLAASRGEEHIGNNAKADRKRKH